jgi:hypothetical protein
MTLNGNAGNHDFYLPDRRARKRRGREEPKDSRISGLNCTLDEKCAWLREKQKQKRGKR